MKNKNRRVLVSIMCGIILASTVGSATVTNLIFKLTEKNEYTLLKVKSELSGTLQIPDSYKGLPVTAIAEDAFYQCGQLTSVVLPRDLRILPPKTLNAATAVANFEIDAKNNTYTCVDGVLLSKDGSALVKFPAGRTGVYKVPENVRSIGASAFSASSVDSVILPPGLVEIGESAFSGCQISDISLPDSLVTIGSWAFAYSYSLGSIKIPANVSSIGRSVFTGEPGNIKEITVVPENTVYKSEDGVLYNKAMSRLISFPNAKRGPYVVPQSVTTIGVTAFEGNAKLTNLTIPNGVTSIDEAAFYGTSLRTITIPSTVTKIGSLGFYMNYSLLNVIMLGNTPPAVSPDTFLQTSGKLTIHVPSAAAVKAYQQASGWDQLNITTP